MAKINYPEGNGADRLEELTKAVNDNDPSLKKAEEASKPSSVQGQAAAHSGAGQTRVRSYTLGTADAHPAASSGVRQSGTSTHHSDHTTNGGATRPRALSATPNPDARKVQNRPASSHASRTAGTGGFHQSKQIGARPPRPITTGPRGGSR